ncbi:MAG: 3-dehydroquinate synthase [Bacteroidales bacterium]|nr:3-dehydroquinate synthase [Bacteroidales bacterium]
MKCIDEISKIFAGSTVAEAASLVKGEELFLVYDAAAGVYAGEFIDALTGDAKVLGTVALEVSEEMKNMDTVLSIARSMLSAGVSRQALVVSIGGGITSDIAGFTASIYKRGIRYANIPTTLLSQVDAAIGGKTGVNLDDYKNMLGVIVQPEFTFICPSVLSTLPRRDFLSGAAELLKTLIIDNSAGLYEKAVEVLSMPPSGDLLPLISAAASVKAGIVSRDMYEAGERKKLNLGHTWAHAIEHEALLRGDDITHGEAVAMGIIIAAERSDSALATRLKADFLKVGLPLECPYPLEALTDAVRRDKKAGDGWIDLIVPHGIGDVRIERTAL